MEKLHDPDSEPATLLIEHDGEIVWFSTAILAKNAGEVHRLLYSKLGKEIDFDPVVHQFENPDLPMGIGFNHFYPLDVILADKHGNVFKTWTEPANFLLATFHKTFTGLRTIVMCPDSFAERNGIIAGVSKLTLKSSRTDDRSFSGNQGKKN